MIAIVDYGLGNVQAFKDVYTRLNFPVLIARSSKDLVNVTKLILPGVGSFDYAFMKLDESGMRKKIEDLVIDKKIPILGVCVGMQIMASQSEEGVLSGLNWIKGKVLKLDRNTILPHMGWNNVKPLIKSDLFNNIENPEFYFLHSYYYKTEDDNHILTISEYGNLFTSAIYKENIFGTQFHPEKSHKNGIKILENFLNIKC